MSAARIRAIKKISNYRIFQNWKPGGGVEFARTNLIYGQNGSGKSTLTSLLLGCATGTQEALDAGMVLDVEDAAGRQSEVTGRTSPEFWSRVRVFNKEFVQRNLAFEATDGPRPQALLTIGEELADAEEQLKKLRPELEEARAEISPAEKEVKSADATVDKQLRLVAKSIVDDLRDSPDRRYRATNVYKRTQVKELLEDRLIALDGASTDLAADRNMATSAALTTVPLGARPKVLGDGGIDEVRRLLATDVVVRVIEELRGRPERAAWVQQGISLHEHLDKCLFCEQSLTEGRRSELAAHFDESLKRLQSDIDGLIGLLDASVEALKAYLAKIPDDTSVYPDLKIGLRQARTVFQEGCDIYCQTVEESVAALKEKKDNPFGDIALSPELTLRVPDVKELERVVREHNEKVGKHNDEARAAARRVELYHVKRFVDDYRRLKSDVELKEKKVEKLKKKVRVLEDEIARMESVDGNPVLAAGELTDHVSRLLGRDELKFSATSDRKHYVIERDEAPATNLSEGEQTAIALLYFLVSVRKNKVKGDPPIVVIDDPVSSLDNEVLFGVSAYMWTELVENHYASQFFLMTHSFELFRHWLVQLESRQRHEGCDYKAYEMTSHYIDRGPNKPLRRPRLGRWETDKERAKILRSEYHLLFSRVAHAVVDRRGDECLADQMNELALMPNAARRMLEAFLSFRCPEKTGSFHVAIQSAMNKEDLDTSIRTRVERYLHTYSHFDGGNISQPLRLTEATIVLRSLFELMHHIDPDHVSSMCEALDIKEHDLLNIPPSAPSGGTGGPRSRRPSTSA